MHKSFNVLHLICNRSSAIIRIAFDILRCLPNILTRGTLFLHKKTTRMRLRSDLFFIYDNSHTYQSVDINMLFRHVFAV